MGYNIPIGGIFRAASNRQVAAFPDESVGG